MSNAVHDIYGVGLEEFFSVTIVHNNEYTIMEKRSMIIVRRWELKIPKQEKTA